MFFTTIINIIFVAQVTTATDKEQENIINNFNNLTPLVYQDKTFEKNVFTYRKIPTKIKKINEKL